MASPAKESKERGRGVHREKGQFSESDEGSKHAEGHPSQTQTNPESMQSSLQSSGTETGAVQIACVNEDESLSQPEISDIVELTEKAIMVLAKHTVKLDEGELDMKRAEMVCFILHRVLSCIKSADLQNKKAFVNGLLSSKCGVKGLAAYIICHWSDVKPCSDPFCPQFCQLLSSFLITVSDISDAVRKRLVDFGLVSSLLRALNTLKKAKIDDALQSRVLSSLILLGNCSQQALDCHKFDNAAHVLNTLAPYLKSTDPSIRMTSHRVAVHLSVSLSEDDLHKLALTPEEVKELVTALRQASANPDLTASVFNVCLSAREILVELDLSMGVECNMALILQSDVHNVIPSILTIDDGETLEAAISFVWTVAVASRDNTLVNGGHLSTASEILAHLSTSESATSKLAEFAFLSLQPDLCTNINSALKYIEGCYLHGRLQECQRVAGMKLISNEPIASLYKAKSLFKLYKRALTMFQQGEPEQNPNKYHDIMKNAKAVVSKLSAAMMNNYIDEEGKEMLDISMMDVIKGSNELNKVSHPHCMLCLCSDADLQKSHVFPKAMLKEFAESVPGRVGERVFTAVNTSFLSPKFLYQYSSSKTLRFYMLCPKCEDLVNKGGEIDFLQSFFLRIFNKADPAKALEQSVVTYGPWLYHFCIGLVFRCIASVTGIPDHANKHEMYQLFLACRKFLVSPNDSCETTPPKVYLFVNPSEVPHKYEDSCIKEALNAAGFCSFQTSNLSNGVYSRQSKTHFVIAHCGIINVLVKFSPDDYQLPSSWEVDQQGGTYVIPAEADREKDIPTGVWVVFQECSRSLHDHLTQCYFRKKDQPAEVISKEKFDTKEYSHLEAWDKCGQLYPRAFLQNPAVFRRLNMLPPGFQINHSSRVINLPANFTVLIHQAFWSNVGQSITLLVGVEEPKKKGIPAPFVIFYRLAAPNGVSMLMGFSVKIECSGYQLVNLCEVIPHQEKLTFPEEFIQKELSSTLAKKGFANLQSLVSFHAYKKHISMMDIKCHDTTYSCWYCKDRCENCLAPNGFGPDLSAQSIAGFPLTFCSQDCAKYYTGLEEKAMLLNVELLPPRKQQKFEARVLLRISLGSGTLKTDEGLKATCLVSHGYRSEEYPNGRFIVVYQLRTLRGQNMVEMFVSDTGVPEELLPHAESPFGFEMYADAQNHAPITEVLVSALIPIHEWVSSKLEKEVALDLNILTSAQSLLFSKEDDKSIKFTTCMACMPAVDIQDLTMKLSKFKESITVQRKVDVELSEVLQILLAGLNESLPLFSKDSSELQRLLHCGFDFLCECIRGLKHCSNNENDDLTLATNAVAQVWKTCNNVMDYTSSSESWWQFKSELVSTLLDTIAKTTRRDEGELLFLLHLLLDFCAKDKNYRQLFGFESFRLILQPLLDMHFTGARFLALLVSSFCVDDHSPQKQKQLLRLTPPDIQILKIHLAMQLIDLGDALHLIKTATLVSDNITVLKDCGVLHFVSQLLEEGAATEEAECAAEIIAILQSVPEKSAAGKAPVESVRHLAGGHQQLHPSAYQQITSESTEIESGYEILRQLVPDLPSIHSLKTLKSEDIYPAIAQCWNRLLFCDTYGSAMDVGISNIITMSVALLLQAGEETEMLALPLLIDVLLSLLCKCLQNKVHKDNTDLSLIQSAVKTALSQQSSQSRVFAMMVLSCYSDQDQESVKDDLKLTKEDIQVIHTLAQCKEIIQDILTFLDLVRGTEDNLCTLRSHGGIDLLGSVIDMSEVEEDVEKAALLLETLLSEEI